MPLFTAENAKFFGQKSAEARKAKMERERQRTVQAAQNAAPAGVNADYVLTRLSRVREILDGIEEEVMRARDPVAKAKLAQSAKYFHEMEFHLAGRPLPGSLRPNKSREKKQNFTIEPLE